MFRFSQEEFVLLTSYHTRMILRHRQKIRRKLIHFINPKLVSKVQEFLHTLAIGRLPTFIGIHVRRTDYIGWLKKMFKGQALDRAFYTYAIQHYSEKFENPVFLVTSDDIPWCKKNLAKINTTADIIFSAEKFEHQFDKAAFDLTVLTQMNHSGNYFQLIS